MEKALSSVDRHTPLARGVNPPLLLLFSQTAAEAAIVNDWLAESNRIDVPIVHAQTGELATWLADHSDGDREIVPVRVAWLPAEHDGVQRTRMRELLAFANPRRPKPVTQARLARTHPERYRVIIGAGARVSELRARFSERNGEAFDSFVERQGVLALERAEREIIGGQYKVPRLVFEDISASARFQALVARLAAEQGHDPADVARAAGSALEEMVASQSPLAIDAWENFGRFVSRAYTIDVDAAPIERLRRINRSASLVFLPSHRSYLDPLVLRPVLQQHGLPPNHVLGGNNLNFWPIGPVARRNGYVFIRRSMKDADVYKAVLREYLAYLLRKRFNVEFYIEGGRTRTGKLRPPRYGILNYLVEGFRESGIDDVFLVPVSMVYDQLHEVAAMAAEEHGAEKKSEGLAWIVNYTRAQRRPFGAVHINFGEPLSLKQALAEDTSIPKLAFEVMHRVNKATPVTGTAIVALALLGGDDGALTYDEGRALVWPLIEYIDKRGLAKVAGLEPGRIDVFGGALERLVREGIVTEFGGGTEPVYEIAPGKHVEAAFYRNNAIHHFVTRAITELALLHVAEGEFADPAEETWQEALRLRDLLKFEFFFPRKRVFADDVRAELSILAPDWEQRPAEPREIRSVLDQAPTLLAHRVLASFIDAYDVVAERLAAHDPNAPVDEEKFLRECLGVGRQYVMQRRLHSHESVSRELFRGALKLAANRELVEPGGESLRQRREEFANDVRAVVRRVEAVRLLASRRARVST